MTAWMGMVTQGRCVLLRAWLQCAHMWAVRAGIRGLCVHQAEVGPGASSSSAGKGRRSVGWWPAVCLVCVDMQCCEHGHPCGLHTITTFACCLNLPWGLRSHFPEMRALASLCQAGGTGEPVASPTVCWQPSVVCTAVPLPGLLEMETFVASDATAYVELFGLGMLRQPVCTCPPGTWVLAGGIRSTQWHLQMDLVACCEVSVGSETPSDHEVVL